MVLKWFFRLLFIFPIFCFGQTKKQEKGISVEAQYLFLVPYNDDIYKPKTNFDLNETSRVSGFTIYANYYFYDWLSLNIGSGYEKINQPNINYVPVLLGLKIASGKNLESFITSIGFGKHIGKFDNSGFLFRWSIGYRFNIYKSILGTTEMYYSYQNLFKTYPNSNRGFNTYNIEAVGLRFGIELN